MMEAGGPMIGATEVTRRIQKEAEPPSQNTRLDDRIDAMRELHSFAADLWHRLREANNRNLGPVPTNQSGEAGPDKPGNKMDELTMLQGATHMMLVRIREEVERVEEL